MIKHENHDIIYSIADLTHFWFKPIAEDVEVTV